MTGGALGRLPTFLFAPAASVMPLVARRAVNRHLSYGHTAAGAKNHLHPILFNARRPHWSPITLSLSRRLIIGGKRSLQLRDASRTEPMTHARKQRTHLLRPDHLIPINGFVAFLVPTLIAVGAINLPHSRDVTEQLQRLKVGHAHDNGDSRAGGRRNPRLRRRDPALSLKQPSKIGVVHTSPNRNKYTRMEYMNG
jgi:hypothetical protein